MALMFLLELKHAPHIFFVTICEVLVGGRYSSANFITCCHSPFCVDMNEANPFICCYDVSAVAMPECLALPNIFKCNPGVILKCYLLQCLQCHGLDFSMHLCANGFTWFLS